MRELLNEAREMLDERDKLVIGDVKFFKHLFEFHYFLLKAVVEVYEDIPLKDIRFLELKKALLGGYYLEFTAKGKKFTIYTDAAQHIYNLLRQYTNA